MGAKGSPQILVQQLGQVQAPGQKVAAPSSPHLCRGGPGQQHSTEWSQPHARTPAHCSETSSSIHDSIEMLSQGWGWVHCEGERRQKTVMGPGPLLAGAGWMTVGLPFCSCHMVTVHSREHLPIPSPTSCLVPCAAACSKCRDSSRGGPSALTGLICPQTPTMSRCWGPGLLHPKVLCNPGCCYQSWDLHRSCWSTAGPPAPQAQPPVPLDTRSAHASQ